MAAEELEVQDNIDQRMDKLKSVIDAYEATAIGSDTDGGELTRQRTLALEAYVGKNQEPAPKGRSQVVDWTVFETIQWILPSLLRIFTAGKIVEFEPFGPEDEQAAEQESQFLNHLVTQKNDWFKTCLVWFQDALLTKNAYVYAFMDEVLQTEIEKYERQSEEQVSLLLQDKDVEVVEARQFPDEEAEPEFVTDELGQPLIDELGQPIVQPPVLTDIAIRKTQAKQRLAFKALAPERCKIDENCPDFTLDECDFFEYWDYVTVSELRAMGYDVPDDIAGDEQTETREDAARDEVLHHDTHQDSNLPDPALKEVKARWIWARHDFDEDGIAELQFVFRVGQFIFEREDVTTIPVSSIVPFISGHRHMGLSIADLVFDIQRIKTHMLRQGLDNLTYANNPREFFSNKVDMDALLLSRPGEKIRVNTDGPVQGHVQPLTIPDVFPSAQNGLLHMDTVTEARVGVNRMFQGIDESNINDHNRIGQLSTMASQRVEMIARIFGNGIERLFKIAHELVIKSGHQADAIRLRGEWVNFDPKQWKTGRDMRVVAPYAAGNKDSLLQRLMLITQIHEKALAGGLPIVQVDDAYNLALEVAEAADLPGDKLFTDPATLPPPEPQPDPTMIALGIEDKNADTKAREVDSDAKLKRAEIDSDERVAMTTAQLNAAVQLLLAGGKSEDLAALESLKARLRDKPVQMANDSITKTGNAVDSLGQSLTNLLASVDDKIKSLQEDLSAPVEVVRDDKGKITGKRVGTDRRFVPLKDAANE